MRIARSLVLCSVVTLNDRLRANAGSLLGKYGDCCWEMFIASNNIYERGFEAPQSIIR